MIMSNNESRQPDGMHANLDTGIDRSAMSGTRVWFWLPLRDDLIPGVLLTMLPVVAVLVARTLPLREWLSRVLKPDMLEQVMTGLLLPPCAGIALGLYYLWKGMPGTITFDGAAGVVDIRRPLHKGRRFPLSDVGEIVTVYDRLRRGMGTNYMNVVTFHKRWMFPAVRLGSLYTSWKELQKSFGGDDIVSLRLLLAARPDEEGRGEDSTVSDWSPGTHWLSLGGGMYYRRYDKWRRLLWKLLISNALVTTGLYYLYLHTDRVVAFANSFHVPDLLAAKIVDYFITAILALIALEIFFARVGLRLDSENRTITVYQCLGLKRRVYPLSAFRGFVVWDTNIEPGLYMVVDGPHSPLLLSNERSPDKLRRLLLETAEVLGIDPWDNFSTHPEPVTPESEKKSASVFFLWLTPKVAKQAVRTNSWLEAKIEDVIYYNETWFEPKLRTLIARIRSWSERGGKGER